MIEELNTRAKTIELNIDINHYEFGLSCTGIPQKYCRFGSRLLQ